MKAIKLTCAVLVTLQLLTGMSLASDGGWRWPVHGSVLTAYRNGDDPYAAGQHRGVDIGASPGTTVVAASAGRVTFAGVVGASGLTVSERTADGRFDLSYLHLGSIAVREGDAVAAGEALGAVGTSGRRSVEAPHLHFGVREAGQRSVYRNPLDFLPPLGPGGAPEPMPVPVPAREPAAHTAAVEPAPAIAAPALGLPGLPAPAAAPALPGLPAAAPLLVPREALHAASRALAGAPHFTALEAPAATRGPAPHATNRFAPARAADPRGLDARVGARGPVAAMQAPASRPASPADARAPHSGDGIDLGWLVACLALVAAATGLGHPEATQRVARRGQARLVTLLRPTPRGG